MSHMDIHTILQTGLMSSFVADMSCVNFSFQMSLSSACFVSLLQSCYGVRTWNNEWRLFHVSWFLQWVRTEP